VWLTAWGKPAVYDWRSDRWVLNTRDHGLAYARGECRVVLKKRSI
jgi:hypothetical protein